MITIKPHLRIESAQGWVPFNFSELWQHRDLMFYLVMREIKSTTHATRLGIFWVLLQPLATAMILTVVMGYLVKVPTGQTPYPVVVLSGLLIWSYFSNTLIRSSNSMVANAYLLTKIYFPRIIIPLVPIVSSLIDMLIMLCVIIATCLIYGIHPKFSWCIVLVTLPIVVMMTAGFGLFATALTVKMRDFGNILPVVLQLGLYSSPVFYPASLVPDKWRWLYELNPLVALIEATRGGMMGETKFFSLLWYPLIVATLALLMGAFYFRISEDAAADTV